MAETRIVFLGPPGSGKGTQAQRIAARLGVPAISTGEMLRTAVSAGTPLGDRVGRILTSGTLVDDDTMAQVVRERLEKPDVRPGFLLDGYPRTLDQAATLREILEAAGLSLDAVLLIVVPEAELVRRALARQREDDKQEVIQRRLDVYRQKTEPLVDLYREQGLLREVDGHQSIDEVTETILAVLTGDHASEGAA